MNSDEFIQNILNTRGRFGIIEGYKERHHIIPKCMGGTNDNDNLIDLTAKEHFEIHKLLAKENPDNISIVSAFNIMVKCVCSNLNKRSYEITPDDYELCRLLYSNVWKCHEPWNKGLTKEYDERVLKYSKKLKGRITSSGFTGHHHSEETKKLLSSQKIGKYAGELNPMFGVHRFGKENPNYGKKHPGLGKGDKNSMARSVKCIETGEIFSTVKEAAEKYNIKCPSQIGHSISPKYRNKTAGGYHWEYVD